jgi:Dolichol-phosphate mannosyltransferase subunit 3 (DPM3)
MTSLPARRLTIMPSLGLRRYQVLLAYLAAFLSAWYYALSNREEIKALGFDQPLTLLALSWAPLLAAVVLALYLLTLLVVGVASFRDAPEAAAQLGKDIAEAKDALRRMGILET